MEIRIEGVRETPNLQTSYTISAETLSRIKIDDKKLSEALDALRKNPEGACRLADAVGENDIDEARKIASEVIGTKFNINVVLIGIAIILIGFAVD